MELDAIEGIVIRLNRCCKCCFIILIVTNRGESKHFGQAFVCLEFVRIATKWVTLVSHFLFLEGKGLCSSIFEHFGLSRVDLEL